MPRGHHPLSQSRVYLDTKNTIKRCSCCMDPNANLSPVFLDYTGPQAVDLGPFFCRPGHRAIGFIKPYKPYSAEHDKSRF